MLKRLLKVAESTSTWEVLKETGIWTLEMQIVYQKLMLVVDRNLTLFVLILTHIHKLRIFKENSLIRRTPHHIKIPNIFSISLRQLN